MMGTHEMLHAVHHEVRRSSSTFKLNISRVEPFQAAISTIPNLPLVDVQFDNGKFPSKSAAARDRAC
jgi:hypothetical protein